MRAAPVARSRRRHGVGAAPGRRTSARAGGRRAFLGGAAAGMALAAGCAVAPAVPASSASPALGELQRRRLAFHLGVHALAVHDGGGRTRMPASDAPMALERAPAEPPIRWRLDGIERDLDAYLARQPVAALWIARGRTVLVARHRYDTTPAAWFLSNSMAKSVMSIGIGFALAEGRIRSADDPAAAYVPALAGHAYGETSVGNLLRMASGVRFSERYDGRDDLARFSRDAASVGIVAAAARFDVREAPQGTRFHYASIESHVLSAVLRGATGEGLSDWLAPRLWRPMGAQADAWWRTDPLGVERGGGFLSVQPGDWTRLGLLLAHGGRRPDTGREVLPPGFLEQSADARRVDPPFRPGAAGPLGYGRQFWLLPGPRRQFALLGVYGQAVLVDPGSNLTMVHLAVNASARPSDTSMARERSALWQGVVASLAGGAA